MRKICITVPQALPPLQVTIPGAGDIQMVRSFALDAYSVCDDARSFMQTLSPVFAGLGLPLCILGCVSSITGVFKTSFPYIDPSALPKVAEDCLCLTGFTPFGFCGMLKGLVSGILSVTGCIEGLLGDIVRLEAQAAALSANTSTAFVGQCLLNNTTSLRGTIQTAFGPVTKLLDATAFLFQFVGVPVSGIGELTGSTTAEVIESLQAINVALSTVSSAVNAVCI